MSRLVAALRYTRPVLFIALLVVSVWQILVLVRSPSNQAFPHLIVALVALGVGARLYVTKSSTLNRALDAIDALHGKEGS